MSDPLKEFMDLFTETKKTEPVEEPVQEEEDPYRTDDVETDGPSSKWKDLLFAAKAREALAAARKLTAEAEKAEFDREVAEINRNKALENEEIRKIGNDFLHFYNFDKSVGEASVKEAIETLDKWSRLCPGCDITIRFMSPGGDVISGMAFFDYLMTLRKKGHKITTLAEGYAASMAGILLQAGTVRQCGAESYILIHEIATAVRGKVGEIEDEMIFIKKISERVLDIFARRAKEAGERGTASKPLSKRQFSKGWERKDWWLTSEEALAFGVVDEVVP